MMYSLCNYDDMKISQLGQKFDLDYDLLPFIEWECLIILNHWHFAWSSIGKNLGLFEIWFQENPSQCC